MTSQNHKKIFGGVCSSISTKYSFNPWILRILFLLTSFFFLLPLLIYLVAWVNIEDVNGKKKNTILLKTLGIKYNKPTDFWKLILGILLIILISLSPLWIGFIGAEIYTFLTDNSCHEGNCIWMVLPWLLMISIPTGGIYLIYFVFNSLKLLINLRQK